MRGPLLAGRGWRRRAHGLFVLGLLVSQVLPSLLLAQALEATFADLKGEVQWAAAGSTEWEAASANSVLHAGDRVRTAANSSARLAFFEGSTADLADNTELGLTTFAQDGGTNVVRVEQAAGVSQAQVQPAAETPTRYEVLTASALTTAPTATCPWVRSGADGSTVVRNYDRSGTAGPTGPIPAVRLDYTQTFLPGPRGPIPWLQPHAVPFEFTPPQSTAAAEALAACPFGEVATALPSADELASGDVGAALNTLGSGTSFGLLAVGPRPPLIGTLAASVAGQGLDELATVVTRQPTVEWVAVDATTWQPVATQQVVRVGDRVRTGPDAAARIVYFEGTSTDLGPNTGILVQRLSRSPEGNIVGRLFQAVGTTISRVTQLADPAASFEIETPAATAFVRGTTPELVVQPSGETRVRNIPDGTGGTVGVRGNDPSATVVLLQPGQETSVLPNQPPTSPAFVPALVAMGLAPGARDLVVRNTGGDETRTVRVAPGQETRVDPGQPPSPPAPIGQGALSPSAAGGSQVQQEQVTRQQQRQQERLRAEQQVAQAQAGLIAAQSQLGQLGQQEQRLQQEINGLLQGGRSQNVPPNVTVSGSGPCATTAGQTCPVGGDLPGSSGTAIPAPTPISGAGALSMQWRISVPAGRIPPGTIATIVIPTTVGSETFDCPPATAAATSCTGTTRGVGRQGGTVQVFVSGQQVAQGSINGPSTVTATPTGTRTPTVTSARSITGTIRNAINAQPLAGATVSVAATGQTATTGPNGTYQLVGVPAGTVQVTAAASGFIPSTQTVIVPAAGPATLDFALSPTLGAGQFRIVLTWGATPRDLDAHLWVPTGAGAVSEVDFITRGSLTSAPFAQLDIDVTTGFGPETMTIGQVLPGQYTFAVNNFSKEAPLPASGAQVAVFDASGQIGSFTVPSSGSGTWWTVFTFSNGTITPVNTLSTTPPLPSNCTGCDAALPAPGRAQPTKSPARGPTR